MENPASKRGLVLFGLAGTGKSTIAREIAERYKQVRRLSSYFVFLRAERSKSEDYLLVTTLIHDLSNHYPACKTALGNAIEKDKSLPAMRDYRMLFKHLVLEPLGYEVRIIRPVLIIIDALDESGDASSENGLHAFLAECLANLPSNFRILITSRTGAHFERPFINAPDTFEIKYMDDSELAAGTADDIRRYFEEKLPDTVTFKHYGDKLVESAQGLFQWAAVACQYIRRPPPGLTKGDCIRGLLEPSAHLTELGRTLAVPLYDLYKQVLEGYFQLDIAKLRFRSVMGKLLAAFEPLSIESLTTLQRYSLDDHGDDDLVISVIEYLGSLLSNVTSTNRTRPIVLLHTSFRDFLTEEKMSGAFYIHLDTAHYQLAHSCLKFMLHNLKFNICNLESSYLLNRDIQDLQYRIKDHIPSALSYACRFWSNHLKQPFDKDRLAQLRLLFERKFLFWLEVLSLTNTVDLAAAALLSLKAWLTSGLHNEVYTIFQCSNHESNGYDCNRPPAAN